MNSQKKPNTLPVSLWKSEAQTLLRKMANDRPVKVTCFVIAVSILTIIVAYGVTASQSDSRFWTNISYEIGLKTEGSSSEVVGYGLAFTAALLFFLSSIETGSRVLLFLAVAMTFVWFDDSAEYHERFGEWLVESYNWNQGVGEIFAWIVAGIILLPLFIYGLRNRRPGDNGVLALVMIGGALLVMCGVLADLAHSLAPRIYDLPLTILEDGGELTAIAWIAIVALGLSRHGQEYYAELESQA